jgi:hypothetical protein
MSSCRDSIVSLWPASFRGVSFLFQIDEEVSVPSLRVQELSACDGRHGEGRYESLRIFEGFAYVTSDHVAAIVEPLTTREWGTLAVPAFERVQIRCDTFKRCSERDGAGYFCFAVTFVGDTAVTGIASASPPRLVLDAADGVAAALVSRFTASLSLGNRGDYLTGAAVYMVETVAASIELVRSTNLIDPGISVEVGTACAAITTAAPLLVAPIGVAATHVANLLAAAPPLGVTYSDPSSTLAAVIVSTIRLLCAGMAGNADGGAAALLELALDYPAVTNMEPVGAASAAAAANFASIIDLVRLAALAAWCEGLVRRSYTSGSDAVTARADAAERLGQELSRAASAGNFVLYATIQGLQNAIVQSQTRLIADLAPNAAGLASRIASTVSEDITAWRGERQLAAAG